MNPFGFWWHNLDWPWWLVLLAVVALVAIAVFLLMPRGFFPPALMVFAAATLVLRTGYAVDIWNILEGFALAVWLAGWVATIVFVFNLRAFGIARGLTYGAFALVALFDIWQYVLIPLWNHVLVPVWYWLAGFGWNWLWVLFAVLVIAAIVLLVLRLVPLGVLAALAALAVVVVLGLHLVHFFGHNREIAGKQPAPTQTQPPKPPAQPKVHGAVLTACQTWKMSSATPKNENWVTNGIKKIETANTPKEARAAFQDWVAKIKVYPGELATAARQLAAHDHNVESSQLIDSHGCATQKAVDVLSDVSFNVGLGSVKPAQAPISSRNSGTHANRVYVYIQPGVGGNRKAIEIILPGGRKVWILARCGNMTFLGHPSLPTRTPPKGAQMPKHHVCPQTTKPSGGVYLWSSSACSWYKPAQTRDHMLNHTQVTQSGTENTNHVYTGLTSGTSGAPSNTTVRSGDSSTTTQGSNSGSSDGSGTPTGGGTDGSGGTTSTNPPADSGQGGTGNGDGGGTIVNP